MKSSPLFRGGRALVLALLALLPAAAMAAGENYGRLAGYVYDPTGSALAEVPLTLTGPAMQQPQTATTNDEGRFEFGTVPPGEGYVLEVSVPGFTPVKQTGIVVRVGAQTPVDVKLQVLTETEAVATYEIKAKVNPILNPDSAQTGATLNSEKAYKAPVYNQVQGVPQMVAGVGPGTFPSARGGLTRYSRAYVDGMDTTDVTDGNITAPMNFYAVENFEVAVGGMDASYNSMGLVQNLVTKSGSNKYTYDVALIASPDWANAKASYASNQAVSAGSYLQREVEGAKTNFYAPNFGVGGPLVKDRLWFFASGQWNFSNVETPITIGNTYENRAKDTQTRLARLKLTWQPSSKDRVSVAFNYDGNTIHNNASSSTTTLAAENMIDRGGYFAILNYDRTLGTNGLFQLSTGVVSKKAYFGPEDDAALDVASHRDTNSGGVTDFSPGALSSRTGNVINDDKLRVQFDPTLTWKLGDHQLKTGVQLSYLMGRQNQRVTTNQRFFDKGGVCNPEDPATFGYCNQVVDFYSDPTTQGGLTTEASNQIGGAFLQDRWTVSRKLTVVPGFRFDVGRVFAQDNAFVKNLYGYGPRLSATYDLFGDRSTLVKAHYGRHNDMGDVFLAQHANPDLIQVTRTFKNGAFPQCTPENLVAGCTVSGGATGTSFDKSGHTPPSVDELSFGVHHEVADETAVGLDATYRRYNNLWIDEEINQIWDASGINVVGYVDPSVQGRIVKITNPDHAWRDYKGVDLWVQGNPGNWDLLASYTLGFNNGTVGDYFDGYGANPRYRQYYVGPTSNDIRHYFKGSIAYALPFGLEFGTRFQYRTGAPLWQSSANPVSSSYGRVYRSPRGTGYTVVANTDKPDANDPENLVELRNPPQFNLDAQVRYDLGKALNTGANKIELTLLFINVLNQQDVYRVQDYTGSTYGMAGGGDRTRPMQAELILRFRN